jgi:hypothetical protein
MYRLMEGRRMDLARESIEGGDGCGCTEDGDVGEAVLEQEERAVVEVAHVLPRRTTQLLLHTQGKGAQGEFGKTHGDGDR